MDDDTSGVPLLDVTTVSDDGGQAVAVYSKIDSGYSNWPYVLVEGESCCVLQLLGLTQFPVVPRHPQHQNPKFINWGVRCTGTGDHDAVPLVSEA